MGEAALSQIDSLSQKDIEVANQLEMFLYGFKRTWAFEKFIRLPYRIIGLFTGNQSMKTSSTAYQYVLRIFGFHPIAKRNVLYFECPNRHALSKLTDDHDKYREGFSKYLDNHLSKDSATYNVDTFPEDGNCHECGAKLMIHPRKTRVFRFASETLPTEKTDIQGDTEQSAEISNTQYPEFKKWLPRFLVKKDITVRNPALANTRPERRENIWRPKVQGC